jgi:hypothetical protein
MFAPVPFVRAPAPANDHADGHLARRCARGHGSGPHQGRANRGDSAKYRVKVMAEIGTCLNVHRAQEFLLAEPELMMIRVGSLRTRKAQRRMQ